MGNSTCYVFHCSKLIHRISFHQNIIIENTVAPFQFLGDNFAEIYPLRRLNRILSNFFTREYIAQRYAATNLRLEN